MMDARTPTKARPEPPPVLMFYIGPQPEEEAKRYPGTVWWPGKGASPHRGRLK